MEWSIVELRRHAMNDQTQFEDRPWTYTDKCSHCGGVKAFIDWLEKESKDWIPSSETQDHKDAVETEIARTEEQKRRFNEVKLLEIWDSTCNKAIEELKRLGLK